MANGAVTERDAFHRPDVIAVTPFRQCLRPSKLRVLRVDWRNHIALVLRIELDAGCDAVSRHLVRTIDCLGETRRRVAYGSVTPSDLAASPDVFFLAPGRLLFAPATADLGRIA